MNVDLVSSTSLPSPVDSRFATFENNIRGLLRTFPSHCRVQQIVPKVKEIVLTSQKARNRWLNLKAQAFNECVPFAAGMTLMNSAVGEVLLHRWVANIQGCLTIANWSRPAARCRCNGENSIVLQLSSSSKA